ncbi:MAG: chemotaxis protein CheW [Salinisphaeraceae bacterium]|nr:chemotaxis protein CheW [Salinisphaeraceae bacterium]
MASANPLPRADDAMLPGIPAGALERAGLTPPGPVDEEAAAAPEPTERFVRFYVAAQSYAIAVLRIQEVLRVSDIASVPGAPSQVLGVVNLRGRIVPVISLRRLLGLPDARPVDAQAEHERLVVVEARREAFGLLVDSVAGLIDLPDSAVEKPPRVGSRAVPITGVVTSSEDVLVLLDVDALVQAGSAETTDV